MTDRSTPEEISLERTIQCPGQLLVEGRTPEMFFREMINAYGWTDEIEVRTFGSVIKDNLKVWMEFFAQKPAFKEKVKRLGIIRDAERSTAASAFKSVQRALGDAGLPVPDQMCKPAGNPVSVSVFVLPNCQDPGMLEHLCLQAVTESEQNAPVALLPCVEEFFACLDKRQQRPANGPKARFGGYALARDVIDPQLGRAAQQGAIPWQAKAFEPLKAFIAGIAGE
jgi:hypothetical protein